MSAGGVSLSVMTASLPPPEAEIPVRDKTVIVDVPKDSRLEALLCICGGAREKRAAAEAAEDEVKAGILAELRRLYPGEDIKVYDIPGGPMWAPMTYDYREVPYLPAPKIREHMPSVYDAFRQFKRYWTLTPKKAGR